jgi:hypothetical protein
MSHLNAVTVLIAAFAARRSKLKAAANQADSTIPQLFPEFRATSSGNLRLEADFHIRDAPEQRWLRITIRPIGRK